MMSPLQYLACSSVVLGLPILAQEDRPVPRDVPGVEVAGSWIPCTEEELEGILRELQPAGEFGDRGPVVVRDMVLSSPLDIGPELCFEELLFQGCTFLAEVAVQSARVEGTISFTGCRFLGSEVQIEPAAAARIQLHGSHVDGALKIIAPPGASLDLRNVTVGGRTQLYGGNMDAWKTTFTGGLFASFQGDGLDVMLSECRIVDAHAMVLMGNAVQGSRLKVVGLDAQEVFFKLGENLDSNILHVHCSRLHIQSSERAMPDLRIDQVDAKTIRIEALGGAEFRSMELRNSRADFLSVRGGPHSECDPSCGARSACHLSIVEVRALSYEGLNSSEWVHAVYRGNRWPRDEERGDTLASLLAIEQAAVGQFDEGVRREASWERRRIQRGPGPFRFLLYKYGFGESVLNSILAVAALVASSAFILTLGRRRQTPGQDGAEAQHPTFLREYRMSFWWTLLFVFHAGETPELPDGYKLTVALGGLVIVSLFVSAVTKGMG